MTDDEFLCAELGIIAHDDIEAYSPTAFQREYLTMLSKGIEEHDWRLRSNLYDLADKNGMIPRNEEGSDVNDMTVLFSFEHIMLILSVRQSRLHGLGMRKTSQDWLQMKLRPAFELVKDLTDPNIDFYMDDLKRRWGIAVSNCNGEGVIDLGPDRMVALTTSPVWQLLGSQDLFDDGLGIDYPPFYINGGWLFGWRTVKAKEIGL